jgi:hypothetical protein
MATGLSSDDEDDIAAAPPVAAADASAFGLSDSDEDEVSGSVGTASNHASMNAATADGLSSDSDDEVPPRAPDVGGGDGLDDSDEDEPAGGGNDPSAGAPPRQASFDATKVARRDPKSHLYNIPALPRPPAGTTYVAKIPPQLGVGDEEFTPRHTATELEEKIRQLESDGADDAEAEIERAEIERDAAKQFVAHGSDFQNHMLWRFKRDTSGAIVNDAKGVAIR